MSALRLFLTVCLLIPAQVRAGGLCSKVFASPGYFRQVIETRGLRLFVKESAQPESTKWAGVVRHVPRATLDSAPKTIDGIRYVAKTLPLKLFGVETATDRGRYELAPVTALYHGTVVRASNHLSREFLNKNLEPAFFSRLPFMILMSTIIWNQIDAYYAEKLSDHRLEIISKNKDLYKGLIQNDFRYRSIKKKLAEQSISEAESLESAYWIEIAYANYFEYRESHPEVLTSLSESEGLLGHLVFNHLEKVFNEGVQSQPGFDVPSARLGPISDAQKLQLLQVNHALALRYQLLTEYVNQTDAFRRLSKAPEVQEALDLSLKTGFGGKIIELAESGRITRGQLLAALQEEAYWQTRFAEWSIIGVHKIKKTQDGFASSEILTLEDIRSEILADF